MFGPKDSDCHDRSCRKDQPSPRTCRYAGGRRCRAGRNCPANGPRVRRHHVTPDDLQSQLLPLARPAAEIIIGNPAIADVTVQSGNLLVITGKSFGITNLIALDAKRQIIFDRRILVKRDDVRVVNLQRGALRQTFNCTPQCNPTVTIGDEQAYFDAMLKSAEKKSAMSEKAADGPGASQ
ncbi:MAG: hypothetical protein HC869_05450 [Rhodospirillales bacterium]|nr:hypothetical protein [Rhodospirillales bacterium]